MFLNREIDLASTDMDIWHLSEQVRRRSPTYQKALAASWAQSAWVHPDTGALVGRVFKRPKEFSEGDILVTSCAALSCLQQQWDQSQIGLHVETRYIEP